MNCHQSATPQHHSTKARSHESTKTPSRESTGLLVALVGPTASGKSTLAVRAAQALDGEVVNCDSVQVYRSLDVGTAKPTEEQRRQVPHHLYDIIDPDQYFSAGRYMVEARKVCREIAQPGQIPFVVGGSGLYLRALLEGVFEGPARSEEIRERLRKIGCRKGLDYLHRLLKKKDPQAALRVQPGDRIRIVRALEIYFLTGKPISELQPRREPLKDLSILKIGLNLPRSILYDRINRRVSQMFRSGLIEEVNQLLDRGYSPDCKGFEALGYRHAISLLGGNLSREEAIKLTQRDTRRYAKRQMTWFRREEDIHWLLGPGEAPETLEHLLQLVEEHRPG
ncbi:MAG: tRNA (adenosine(37)-N6)-dimethylallyltransferase MiaA [Acidobacteriota bacterium]